MMQEEWREEEEKEVLKVRELLMQYCMGDEVAVQLCEDLLYVAHVFDDIYDKDKDRTPQEINAAYAKALGDIPNNPLYQANIMQIAPMTLLTIQTWQISNRLESGSMDDKIGSFILRNSLLHLIYLIIMIVGASKKKPNWSLDVGEMFFKDFFKGYHNQYIAFLDEMEEKNQPIPIKKAKKRAKR
jgi:hypothetical protein